MRRVSAVTITDREQAAKQFTEGEFYQIMRSNNFIGAVAFWRALERLAGPESQTCCHAMGILRELAGRAFDYCQGWAFSPQQAECLRYCGVKPVGVRPPGSAARDNDSTARKCCASARSRISSLWNSALRGPLGPGMHFDFISAFLGAYPPYLIGSAYTPGLSTRPHLDNRIGSIPPQPSSRPRIPFLFRLKSHF
jgi:hypothetical protein